MVDFTFATTPAFLRHLAGVNMVGCRLDLGKPAIRDHALRFMGAAHDIAPYDTVSPPEWVGYPEGCWWLQHGEQYIIFAPDNADDVVAVTALENCRPGDDDLEALFHTLIYTLEMSP
jgi:hypothetical protein